MKAAENASARSSRCSKRAADLTMMCGLRGLGDLAGLEAAGADADMRVAAVDGGVDALEVRQRALLRLVVRVAHLVAGEGALATEVALERHRMPALIWNQKRGRANATDALCCQEP